VTRLYFNVFQVGNVWEVQAANAEKDEIPAHFKSEPEAVAFAMHLAREVWRGTGTKTGVRVQVEHDDWREVLRCGEPVKDC
jgi:hypothetical protein